MSGESAEYWARRYMAQPWGGKDPMAYRRFMAKIRAEMSDPMKRCPSCEEPGYPTLLAWPERSNPDRPHKYRQRYGLCVLCGYRFIIWEPRKKTPGQPRFFEGEKAKRIEEMWLEEGWTAPEIAKLMHCAPGTIRNTLKRLGHTFKHGGSAPLRGVDIKELETVRFLYEKLGWRQKEIAAYMGVPPWRVQSRVKQGHMQKRDEILAKIDFAKSRGKPGSLLV